jgi:hypothetical protein
LNRESRSRLERVGGEFRAKNFGIGGCDNKQRKRGEYYVTNLASIKPLRKENIIMGTALFARSDQSKRHEGDLVRNF